MPLTLKKRIKGLPKMPAKMREWGIHAPNARAVCRIVSTARQSASKRRMRLEDVLKERYPKCDPKQLIEFVENVRTARQESKEVATRWRKRAKRRIRKAFRAEDLTLKEYLELRRQGVPVKGREKPLNEDSLYDYLSQIEKLATAKMPKEELAKICAPFLDMRPEAVLKEAKRLRNW